jgi:hypothetical protein
MLDIALQTEEHGRFIDKFNPAVTLWQILIHFESKHQVNLTKRSGLPPKQGLFSNFGKSSVYMIPVLIFMNKEYSSLEELFSTSLESTGLTSGNGVIRLLFKYATISLQEAAKEIRALEMQNASVNKNNPHTASPTSSVDKTSKPLSDPPTGSIREAAQTTASVIPEPLSKEINRMDSTPDSTDNHLVAKETGETGIINVDRNLLVFRPPPPDYTMTRFELPDSFYELSSTELKYLLSGNESRIAAMSNAPLKTKMMRDREKEEKMKKHPRTCIRIRFPDRMTLQFVFLSNEKGMFFLKKKKIKYV